MDDIKLFVCCHQPAQVPEHPLLLPVQVGTALANSRFPGFLYDDTGDNISSKNRSYCELTAQYWAWKNIQADYYGFFHYRRYLYSDIKAKLPYRVEQEAALPLLDKLGYAELGQVIRQYDLIVPKGENMYIPVRQHYVNAPYHNRRDLELMEQIIMERYPEMALALESYLSGTVCYFGNIYIMRREIFYDYCAWLFPILEEFDRRADISGYSLQEQRVDGYLAERLLGGYLTHCRERRRVLELPGVHFHSGREYAVKKTLGMILPPGSRRRYVVKRAARALKAAALQ